MISPVSQVGTGDQDREEVPKLGIAPQRSEKKPQRVAITAISTKQARAPQNVANGQFQSHNKYRNTLQAFALISRRALFTLTKKGYLIFQTELDVLQALETYGRGGIVQIESFLKIWFITAKQARVHGAIFGLIKKGHVQIFEQRTNGTRYIGLTPLGAKLLTVYYGHCERLIERLESKQARVQRLETAQRFKKVQFHQLTIYTFAE